MELEPVAHEGHELSRSDTATGMVGGVYRFAGWAFRTGYGMAKKVPGAATAERGVQQLERAALSELRKRLGDAEHGTVADDPPALRLAKAPVPGGVPVIARHGDFEPLRATMADLLERSLAESVTQARENLYSAVLAQLTPDEARILSAFSDGTQVALIDIVERVGANASGRQLLRDVCSIGTRAGVTLHDQVSVYVNRLAALHLVERGAEVAELAEDYDILLTDPSVRATLESAKRTKIVRRSLRISAFGAALWRACDPSAW